MIQYALKCDDGHQFQSWFASAAAYDALEKAGHLSCAICGGDKVHKAVMAPSVANARPQPPAKLCDPQSETEKVLKDFRKHVESHADYVGGQFAQEARAMYLGSRPERAIYGEASGAEAKALIDDGIPVAPLPFLTNRKAN